MDRLVQPARHTTTTTHLITPNLPLLAFLLLALAIVAAGCGAASGSATGAPRSADAVHQGWVKAVREGDTDGALALTDPELPERESFARDAVSRMQDYLTNPASPTGALEDVMVEPVSDGVGRSVWQFAQKRWCYRAELVHRGGGWYVSRWGQTSVACS
jgi:hypothetical protein